MFSQNVAKIHFLPKLSIEREIFKRDGKVSFGKRQIITKLHVITWRLQDGNVLVDLLCKLLYFRDLSFYVYSYD